MIEVNKCQEIDKGEYSPNQNKDSTDIETFRFRLFEQILNPIFGKCDNLSKNERIAILANDKKQEIDLLKNKCEGIAREIVLMPTREIQLKQKRLNELIENEITIPLSEMTEQPIKKIKELLLGFVVDSTVIGGVLAVAQGADSTTLKMAAAAGAISAAAKYIINSSKEKTTPSGILIAGMEQMRIKYERVQRYLSEIPIEQLDMNIGRNSTESSQ